MPKINVTKATLYPLAAARERLSILKKMHGLWKNRKPDPVRELQSMRKEWDRMFAISKK